MLVMLKGRVQHRGHGYIILEQGNFGYKIILPESAVWDWPEESTIYVHQLMRDEVPTLFGFSSIEALELFWRLIGISGVGPRIAQKIIWSGKLSDIKQRIMSGDVAFIKAVPGIGLKTAQKIILELKGVLADEPVGPHLDEDALAALLNLGYTRRQAEAALQEVKAETTDDRIRQALKNLAR